MTDSQQSSATSENVAATTNADAIASSPQTPLKIAAVIMCKNESGRIHVTIDSVQDHLDGIVLFDTGSTDATIEIATRRSTKIPLHVVRGEFENFGASYTAMLRHAIALDAYDYFVHLDANDEFRGTRPTDEDVRATMGDSGASNVRRVLKISEHETMTFWYPKLFSKSATGSFVGPVYEYYDGSVEGQIKSFDIYQDRRVGCESSVTRWQRDCAILEREHADHPDEPRTTYYLAQTYSCLGQNQLAYDTYAKRANMDCGFFEERFNAMCLCGQLAEKLAFNWHVRMAWYMRAFEFDPRAEPLVSMAEYYRSKRAFVVAYAFAKMAVDLPFPTNRSLFVCAHLHDYQRYHLLATIGYYAWQITGNREMLVAGHAAAIKALATGVDVKTDSSNIKWYERSLANDADSTAIPASSVDDDDAKI